MPSHHCRPTRPTPPPSQAPLTPHPAPPPALNCTRRFSFAGLAALPLVDAFGREASLWSQEADLVRRKLNRSLDGIAPRTAAKPGEAKGYIDAEFASALLAAVRKAAGRNTAEFDEQCRVLRSQELPFFQEAGTCGHCGTKSGPSALSDRDYFDFEAYIQIKALLKLCPPATPAPTPDAFDLPAGKNTVYVSERQECANKFRDVIGQGILAHILAEIDVGDAAAAGISPIKFMNNDALLSASPELDSIRRGCRALMIYFRKKGFMFRVGISQFGLSADEYEVRYLNMHAGFVSGHGFVFFGASKNEERNHMVWARGEPAYLKYWLGNPADLRSASALQTEEGACMSLVGAAVAAYLKRCGVEATMLRRVPSLSEPSNAAEQWTLRRVKDLPNKGKSWEKGYADWKPDVCPGGFSQEECF